MFWVYIDQFDMGPGCLFEELKRGVKIGLL
jgi:hypothetical protein